VIRVLFKLAQRLGDVSGDGRFFRNDEYLAHLLSRKLAEKISFVNTRAIDSGKKFCGNVTQSKRHDAAT